MNGQGATCPNCDSGPIAGRYCRDCGTELATAADSHTLNGRSEQQSTGPRAQPPLRPPPPAPPPPSPPPSPHQPPTPAAPPMPIYVQAPMAQAQPARDGVNALAVVAAITLMLVLLGIAATIILLVANGDSSHAGVLTQSTVSGAS